MSFIKVIHESEASGELKEVYERTLARLGAASRPVISRNDSEATLYEEEFSCKF